MLFLSSLSIGLSVTFMFMSHPLSILAIIISQTIIMSMLSGMLNVSYWFSFILFLIFIGGMLVLFVYIASLASNEIFLKMNMFKTMKLFIIPAMIVMLTLMSTKSLNYSVPPQNSNLLIIINKFYVHNFILTLLLIMFLLVTLFVVVHVTKFNQGPLRTLV